MSNIFKTKYRIVTDRYCGFECQIKRWWWPVWIPLGFTNTFFEIEEAEDYIKRHKYNPHNVVKYID